MASNTVSLAASRMWASYCHALDARPLLTKSFTSFFGFIAGDSIAQLTTRQRGEKFDFARTARFAAFGFFLHAPPAHFYYQALDKMVYPAAAQSTKAIFTKLCIDQIFWTPISLCVFYAALKTMEGEPHKIKETIKEKFWPTLLAGYTVWPLAHIINFRFIPTEQRVLYVNVVQTGWNMILCRIATSKSGTRFEPSEEPVHLVQVDDDEYDKVEKGHQKKGPKGK